ncbi:MAG: S-layer homology domain-containing protein [Acutalibacter sp.]
MVLDVVAGNFDGNDEGREQILCVTGLEKYYYQYESYEEDGDEQESVDSSRLTVMTRSENAADVEILLFGAQDNGSYPTSGAEVNLSVEAIVTADYQYNTSYQWQILRPDNWKDGISNWTNLSAKEEGIESVEASQNSLRLTGLDSSLDGARLRCRVTVPTSDATPNDYYSDAVTLEISLDSTETSLSLSGSADDRAAGSLDDPYTGNAGYSITTTTTTSGEVEQDVAIPAGESHPALKVYSYTAGEESTPVYVGVGTDEGETVYYAVTKTETSEGGAAYSVGDKLTLGGTKWVKATASGSGTEEYTVPEGYDGTIETDPSTGYRRMALVKTEDSSTTFTEYWMSVPAGDEETAVRYFTKNGESFTEASLEEDEEEALRYVYVGSGEEVLIVNAAEEGSDGPGADDDRYVTYAVSGGTLSAPTVFWGEADTGLYATDGEGQKTLYAGSTGLTVERETVTQEQTSTTTASYGGTEITVAAKTTVDTSILFTFANLTTGGSESVQAGADGTATWQAAVPGMYRVTATAQATETAASSTSAALYYYAGSVSEGATTEYRLVVSKGSAPASSMVYDGSSVALTLQSRTAATANGGTVTSPSGSWQDVEDNVSYTVLNLSGSDEDAAAIEGSAYYRPQAAGTYRFTASLGGVQVATAQLEVARADITIAPAWEGMEDETVPAALDEIQLTASGGFLTADQSLLERAIAVQCDLYGSDGAIRDVGGVYDVTLSYKSDGEGAAAAAELQSKYNITLASGEITYLSHSAVVNYSAGENGTLQAQYVENSEYGFVSGASIPVSYGLRFVATPAVGFQFAEWTVTLNGTAVAWEDEAFQGIVTFTETESAAILRVSSLEALIQAVQGESEASGEDAAPVLQVQAAFTSQNRTVTFSADESTPNGTVTAQQDGQSLNSGVSVAHGSTATFTATPNEGYVVESWVVNGRMEQNPDGTYYTGTTLEREITEDTEVKVTFAAEEQYAVSYEVVDENNQPVSGVAVTVEGLTDGKVTKGGNVAFTAQPSVGVVIQRWEVKRGEGEWETVSASANRYTLYNVQADTNVRIVASGGGSNRYTLTFGVVDDTSSPVTGGTLTATSNGVTLETGTEYPSYTNVDFTFTEAEAYEVVEWKVNTDTVQEGRDRLTYTLENPSADTTVNVVVREKPSVTVNEVSNGTVDVTYTLDGETVQPSENGYVYTGTGISVTLAPATGYVVDAGEMEATYGVDLSYTDGSGATTDNMTYTIDNVQSDVTIAPVWEQLAAYTVGYYVVDTIGDGSGTHGALSASVERKGMDSYENSEFVSGNTVYDGSTATFTASPENGYIVQEWQVDGEVQAGNTSNTLTLSASELTADTTVTVQFREIGDKVTISAGENGEITSAIAGGVDQIDNMETGFTLDEGASVTITAQPETGYEVTSWSVNGERIENTQGQNTFTYTSQSANTGAAISVEFQQVTYAVSWSAAGGTVTADGYTGTSADIRGGTEVSFTAEPAYGYELTGWTVNGEPQNGESDETFTWTVPNGQAADPAVSSYQIEALFELVDADYTLTYTVAGSGGTISVPGGENGSVTVSHGGSITFTAAPDQYYHVNEWMVDGEPVTEGGSADRTTLTLTNVTAAHTIAVSFTGAVRYDVNYAVEGFGGTVSATANGESIASDTTVQVLGGSKLVFTAAPEEKYMVARWTVNGEEVTRGNMAAYGMTSPYQNTLTVENLTSALTVRVFFEVYNGYLIPENGAGYTITDVVRTPGETYEGATTNEIRKGGDVTFTVGLNVEGGYANFSKLVINGYDCLEQTGTAAGCDSVTATRNSDGSYTVTIQNVNGKITTDIEAHQLVINEGLEDYDIPDSLENLEIDTPEEIQTLLSTAITGSYDGITYMDIALMYWDGSQWVVVTEMPEGGVDVVVPYDTINTEAASNDTFTVAHMLTTGENAGQVDIIEDVRKESDGLHFHVNSLSPFAISWTKYEAPVTPGGGGGTPSEPEEPTWPFTDVTEGDDWFYDAVAYVYENGIMAGTGETTFAPYMELDRAMAAQLFYNLEGKPTVTGDSTFTDVTSGHWAVDAITWAAQNDIVAGIGGGLYDPDSNVTREQFAVMLYKYARFKGYDLTATGDLTQFPDAGSISSWAETALSWANGKGLINGHENGTIDPKGSTIRAQAASILAQFDQSFANK